MEFSVKIELDAYSIFLLLSACTYISTVRKPVLNRANLRSSFRAITCFALELQCFVCDHATPQIIESIAFPYTTCESEIN